ncbi:hypothetical protein M404DRAFT_1005270 [Pisolithus tinctorius Marx 270]|uniref:Uncharacterized protein n=1 Tax=Pisolithus tinctorius Marx 270 TaxID=870435 RepID=A0A0C3NBS1_PISTI|nr:hypothetical protein M404DRAFT_1005270 [Pisolithus tinctorius Marx 270]
MTTFCCQAALIPLSARVYGIDLVSGTLVACSYHQLLATTMFLSFCYQLDDFTRCQLPIQRRRFDLILISLPAMHILVPQSLGHSRLIHLISTAVFCQSVNPTDTIHGA